MRILLIVYDDESFITTFPSGLAYIAAVLCKDGYEVEIYNQDLHHYPEEHLKDYLERKKFDIVGMGVIGGYYQYKKLLKLSLTINRSNNRPDYYIIGGHGPSPEPEYFLRKTGADIAVIGEGEETVKELFKAISNKTLLKDVKGIVYRDGSQIIV